MRAEEEIEQTVDRVLGDWIAAEQTRTRAQIRPSYSEEWEIFAAWARHYDVSMFAGGRIVAAFLLERAAGGAQLDDLADAATAVDFYYNWHRAYLDPEPIGAALALIAAQTSPDRTLN
jgi:hypothetical protein